MWCPNRGRGTQQTNPIFSLGSWNQDHFKRPSSGEDSGCGNEARGQGVSRRPGQHQSQAEGGEGLKAARESGSWGCRSAEAMDCSRTHGHLSWGQGGSPGAHDQHCAPISGAQQSPVLHGDGRQWPLLSPFFPWASE